MKNGREGQTGKASDEPATHPDGGERHAAEVPLKKSVEIGGRQGPEPTRFGDWEKNGRCIDF